MVTQANESEQKVAPGATPAFRIELNRLRLLAIVAPAGFVAAVMALTVALLDHVQIALLVSIAILIVTAAAVPLASTSAADAPVFHNARMIHPVGGPAPPPPQPRCQQASKIPGARCSRRGGSLVVFS